MKIVGIDMSSCYILMFAKTQSSGIGFGDVF